MAVLRSDLDLIITIVGAQGPNCICVAQRVDALPHLRQGVWFLHISCVYGTIVNTGTNKSIFLGIKKHWKGLFGDRMFNNYSFKLLIDLELLEIYSFCTRIVGSVLERASSRNEVDLLLQNFYVSKSA